MLYAMRSTKRVDTKNSEVVRRTDYTQTLEAIIRGGFCPFCEEHLFKHHRQPLIYKSKHWLVTKNAWPYKGSRYHLLFIARKHVESIENMALAGWADLQKLYRHVTKKYRIKGATLMIRSGGTKYTGATVTHLHAHLITGSPRTKRTKPMKALVGFAKE